VIIRSPRPGSKHVGLQDVGHDRQRDQHGEEHGEDPGDEDQRHFLDLGLLDLGHGMVNAR